MNAARVVFMGSPAFAVPSLAALAERPDLCTVAAVVTQPDRPAGRGRAETPPPVKIAAAARGIPILQPTKMRAPATRAAIAEHAPDLVVVAAYGRILPPTLLELPARGCINVHASLLPRHRGASPIAHALFAGDPETGVCLMQMEEGLDTGPVYSRVVVRIADTDTAGSLTITLAERGAALLIETLPAILAGTAIAVPQDDAAATYAPLLAKSDGQLDFTRPAEELWNRVRGLHPWPGAFAFKGGQRIQIVRTEPVFEGSGESGAEPGTILEAGAEGVTVACGRGALRLLVVKPAGKREIPASAWAAGRGAGAGERFDPAPPACPPA